MNRGSNINIVKLDNVHDIIFFEVINHSEPPPMLVDTSTQEIHPGFETQGRCHQKSKTGVSVAPRKELMSSKNLKKKKGLNNSDIVKSRNGVEIKAEAASFWTTKNDQSYFIHFQLVAHKRTLKFNEYNV